MTQQRQSEITPSIQAKPRSRSLVRMFLLIVVPVLALVGGVLIYLSTGRIMETDNAYVKADLVHISSEVAGRILQVAVTENQQVQEGELLFSLDTKPFEVAVAKARATLAQVKTDLAALKASYSEKQAELALAKSRLDYALSEQSRQEDLLKKHYVSDAQYDLVRQATDEARLQIQAVTEELKRIEESLGGSVDLPIVEHPNYLAAQAELAERELDLQRTQVVAPQTGTVRIPPKKGQFVNAGSTAMTLVVDQALWIEANYTETSLTYVQPGQTVNVTVDTYPDYVWHGTVESLSPATSSEFSVLPAQNATGNWVKIAQRVPVRIRLEDNPQAPKLRAGLSVITQIDTGHQRELLGVTL